MTMPGTRGTLRSWRSKRSNVFRIYIHVHTFSLIKVSLLKRNKLSFIHSFICKSWAIPNKYLKLSRGELLGQNVAVLALGPGPTGHFSDK